MRQYESSLQMRVAEYLCRQYPDVQFHSDFGSGVKLSKIQAVTQLRQNGYRRGWPDMLIAKPIIKGRTYCGGSVIRKGKIVGTEHNDTLDVLFCGLFLELKKDGETLYPGPRAKKRFKSIDGKEYKNEHLMEQADVLFKLRKAGYAAEFAIGFDEAIRIIDEYLGGKHAD